MKATGRSYDDKWQWEKVSPSSSTHGDGSDGGTNGIPNGDAEPCFRWCHTEAVRLLERALAVHREVSVGGGGGGRREWGGFRACGVAVLLWCLW